MNDTEKVIDVEDSEEQDNTDILRQIDGEFLIDDEEPEEFFDTEEDWDFRQEDINFDNVDTTGNIFSPQIEVFEPFAAHVDASRTNMSAKQLLQTVTTKNNDAPFILNKNYRAMTDINSIYVEYAEDDGAVLYSQDNFLIIYYKTLNKLKEFYIPPVKRMTNNALTLKYKMDTTKIRQFKKGDVLFDYTGQIVDSHVPRIGYRAKILYGSFYGYTADDAFVMSESFSKRTTIDYSKKLLIPISKELKFHCNSLNKYLFEIGDISDEDFLKYQKIDSSDNFISEFANISEQESLIYGKAVDSIDGGTIVNFKVHVITKKKFDELEQEYIYTPGLINEVKKQYQRQLEVKKRLYASLEQFFPAQASIDLTNKIFREWESADDLPPTLIENLTAEYKIEKENIDYVLEIEVLKSEPTCLGDKFANVFAGKGVCSLILPDDIMPRDENNEPVDIIFNPLGLFGRNNWGTVFELALSNIIEDVQRTIDDLGLTKNKLYFINEYFIRRYDDDYYQEVKSLLNDFENRYVEFKTSVEQNGFYLFVDNFVGIPYKSFLDDFITPYEKMFHINATGKQTVTYPKELMEYMRKRGFVSNVFSKSMTQEIAYQAYIGKNYWIKLFHTSISKYNSISFASSYSKTTGEPPRGRSKDGGVHISWQTTAALEGHIENNPQSVELRTIKSDATQDKNIFIKKMIKDGTYILKPTYKSPTIGTINNSLKMLGMQFKTLVPEQSVEKNNEILEISDLFADVVPNDLSIGTSDAITVDQDIVEVVDEVEFDIDDLEMEDSIEFNIEEEIAELE